MKREDAMQGYWSVAVDEKRPSLAVDDVVLVGAPAWWRTVAMEEAGCNGEVVVAPMVYEWGNGGGGGGVSNFGMCLSEMWESYKLSPRLKFRKSHRLWIGR